MDPNENIKRQRELAAQIIAIRNRRTSPRGADYEVLAAELAEIAQALDEWRLKGGFDPYADLQSPLKRIHEVMDGEMWSPDTLDAIAQVLHAAGFEIRPPTDKEDT